MHCLMQIHFGINNVYLVIAWLIYSIAWKETTLVAGGGNGQDDISYVHRISLLLHETEGKA